MIFRIERTSDVEGKNPPCKNAYLAKRERPYSFADYERNYWEIKVNSLKDLLQLTSETKQPLVILNYEDQERPIIEIYDDHRE